jgi:sigma-E factor negative regulatory protein RseA
MTALHNLAAQADTPPRETRLSALLDGELDDAAARAVLREVVANVAQREQFSKYCRIGDALRGDGHDSARLRGRVMAALEEEPTLLAPMPKAATRQPTLWLAAATVAAITWGLWSMAPRQEDHARTAANEQARLAQAAHADDRMVPYLAAHQDFAQAVVAPSEMRFTPVTLAEAGR